MVCAMGGEKVRTTANIKKGLLYQDGRDRIARVHDYFEGIVILDWLDTGNQSQCKEQQFCKRFSLYGNGHVPEIVVETQKVTNAGQIKKGDRMIISTSAGVQHETAVQILNAGKTGINGEEIIIEKRRNRYFIVDMYLKGTSWAKEVCILKAS